MPEQQPYKGLLPAKQETQAPSLGREDHLPGGGHVNPLQYSCLENPMGTGAWWATVHGVAESRTQLKQLGTQPYKDLREDHLRQGK